MRRLPDLILKATLLLSITLLFFVNIPSKEVKARTISIAPVAIIQEQLNSYQLSSKNYAFDISLNDYPKDEEIEIRTFFYESNKELVEKVDISKRKIFSSNVTKKSDSLYRVNVRLRISELENKTHYFIVGINPFIKNELELSESNAESSSGANFTTGIQIPFIITINTDPNNRNPIPKQEINSPQFFVDLFNPDLNVSVKIQNESKKYMTFGSELIAKNQNNEIYLTQAITSQEKNFLNPNETLQKSIKVEGLNLDTFFPYSTKIVLSSQINNEVQVLSEEREILIIPRKFILSLLALIVIITIYIFYLLKTSKSLKKVISKYKKGIRIH